MRGKEEGSIFLVSSHVNSQDVSQSVMEKTRVRGLYSMLEIDVLQRHRPGAYCLGRRERGYWDLLARKQNMQREGGMWARGHGAANQYN